MLLEPEPKVIYALHLLLIFPLLIYIAYYQNNAMPLPTYIWNVLYVIAGLGVLYHGYKFYMLDAPKDTSMGRIEEEDL